MSENQGQSGKNTSMVLVIVLAVGVLLCGGIGVVGILAAIAIPNFVSMQYKSKRAEVPTNLKGIKTALIQYESNYDTYVDCAAYPASPTKTTQTWVVAESGGFEVLNWQPFGDVRGSYRVEITNGGRDFIATGISDVDGDGVSATYVATKSTNPSYPITSPDIY